MAPTAARRRAIPRRTRTPSLTDAGRRSLRTSHSWRRGHTQRDVWRARPQAQAPALRCMHAKGTTRAWTSCDRSRSQSTCGANRGGHDPRRSPTVNRARGEAISEGHRRNRSWAHEHSGQRDEAWFKREIAPKLDAFSLKEIGKAAGLSLTACSRIRAGTRVPHPRHWQALLKLLGGGERD